MNTTATQLLVAAGAVASLLILWRVAARKRRRQRDAAINASAGLMSLFGRVTGAAVLIVGVQWIVIITAADNHGLLLAVLGIPALFTAYTLVKALTVTTVDVRQGRGGRR
jgi:hypothetical protein